jgi:hypothetical protein
MVAYTLKEMQTMRMTIVGVGQFCVKIFNDFGIKSAPLCFLCYRNKGIKCK